MTAEPEIDRDANSMRRKGKSFWLASLILPRDVAANASRLYRFCRAMDDLADENQETNGLAARIWLPSAIRDLKAGSSSNLVISDFLDLAAQYQLPIEAAICLVETMIWDAQGAVAVETEEQLLRYCFGAAGTVGLLMCPLLHCRTQGASPYAVHLGIAMQMTNIARDVLEDAGKGRRYLPAEWGCTYAPAEIASSKHPRMTADIARQIDRLLVLADAYYASAAIGFPMIPPSSRSAIRVAAAVYREIGQRIRAGGFQWTQGRTVVPNLQRLAIASRVWMGGRSVEGCSSVRPAPIFMDQLTELPGISA